MDKAAGALALAALSYMTLLFVRVGSWGFPRHGFAEYGGIIGRSCLTLLRKWRGLSDNYDIGFH